MGRKINIRATKVGADGTGYFRGDDGNYYYGNQQNGYLTETEYSAKQRAKRSQETENTAFDNLGMAMSGGESLLGSLTQLMGVAAYTAMMQCMMISCVIFGVMATIIGAWPTYLFRIIRLIADGIVGPDIILSLVAPVTMIVMLRRSIRKVKETKVPESKKFLVICIAVPVLLDALLFLLLGVFGLGRLIDSAFNALTLACLPACILCYVEHEQTKALRGDDRTFLEVVAEMISGVFIGRSKGLMIVGFFTALFGIMLMVIGLIGALGGGMVYTIAMTGAGLLVIAFGWLETKVGKIAKRAGH